LHTKPFGLYFSSVNMEVESNSTWLDLHSGDILQHTVVITCRHFGTTCRSILKGQEIQEQ